jgi:hypothetical protein
LYLEAVALEVAGHDLAHAGLVVDQEDPTPDRTFGHLAHGTGCPGCRTLNKHGTRREVRSAGRLRSLALPDHVIDPVLIPPET